MRPSDIRAELPPLVRLALPLIAGELGWVAMSVVDTMLVGRLPHSAVSMGAAALAQVLFNTLMFGTGGILLGLDTLISEAFGAREIPAANRWLVHGILLAGLLSVALTGVFLLLPFALAHFPVDGAILSLAVPALRGLTWGTVPLLLCFALRRYLQAGHHARPIAFALISANVVNAAGDWLLMFGHRWQLGSLAVAIPAWGVRGSAWSTSFARVYLMAVLAVAVWAADRRHRYGLRTVSLRIEAQHLRRMFALGAPIGGSIFIEVAIFALVTSAIATFGALPLAGHEVALQIASTTFMVPMAISSATTVRVGHALGRRRIGQATSAQVAAAGWSGIAAGAAFMLAAGVVLLLAPAAIARLFTPDRAVIAAAVPLLLIAAGFQFFDGVQVTAAGALRGVGDTTTALWTQLCAYWAVGMPLGLLLGYRAKLGAAGLWWGLLIALGGAAVTLVLAWRRSSVRLQAEAAVPLAIAS